jgi:hypothetical protein
MTYSFQAFPSGNMRGPYFGKVISYDVITADVKAWTYELDVVEKAGTGWDDFDVPADVSGVINVFESGNTVSRSMGILHSGLPGTYELQPCPVGTIVPFWAHPNGFVMMWPNQFDGDC